MRGNKWSADDQARFLKGVGELLVRGYPLAEAMESLSFYLDSKRKVDIKTSLEKLREGHPFHLILYELHFDKDLVSYVYFAEQHGGMGQAIAEGSEMILKRQEDYQRMNKLGAYPIFLFFLTGLMFYFVNHVLLPKFTVLFHDMNLSPNLFMRGVLTTSSLFPYLFSILLFFVVIGGLYYFFFFKKLTAIEKKGLLSRIPVAGKLFKLVYTHFFSVQLSYLFSGGLSILDALKTFEKNHQQAFSRELGQDIIQKLATGLDFDHTVAAYPFFEADLPKIIRHGQKNGKLDQELYFYSRHCLNQLEEAIDKAMKILQPVLYSLIGLLIISLYLAILLPMFQLMQGI